MHARLLNVLHHATNKHALPVIQAIHIDFDGVIQKVVQKNGRVIADFDSLTHIALKVGLFVNDFHRPTTQHVARTHNQGVTDLLRMGQSLTFSAGCAIGGLTQTEFVQQLLKALTVFGHVNGFGACANNRYAVGF